MMRHLTILVTGALAAFAFAALPTIATAGEFTADCENGTAECSATFAGGATALTNSNGEKISCQRISGTARQRNNSSTGTVEATFTGCFEGVSGFRFRCNSPGAAAGEITTNTAVSHLIYLDPNATTPGVLLTGVNVTFSCGTFLRKTITGNIIGHSTNPQCGTFLEQGTATFEESATTGLQKYTQITTTGTGFDLISNNDNGGTYLTSAATGEGTLTAESPGERVKFTC
jgi:hypothetical protein